MVRSAIPVKAVISAWLRCSAYFICRTWTLLNTLEAAEAVRDALGASDVLGIVRLALVLALALALARSRSATWGAALCRPCLCRPPIAQQRRDKFAEAAMAIRAVYRRESHSSAQFRDARDTKCAGLLHCDGKMG